MQHLQWVLGIVGTTEKSLNFIVSRKIAFSQCIFKNVKSLLTITIKVVKISIVTTREVIFKQSATT